MARSLEVVEDTRLLVLRNCMASRRALGEARALLQKSRTQLELDHTLLLEARRQLAASRQLLETHRRRAEW